MKKYTAQKTRETSVGWMLKVLTTSLDSEMNNELKRLDLNISHFAVLMTLLENEGLTQTEIGKKIVMPGYATTRTIDALEQKKLVKRYKDENSRRVFRIHLTDEGHDIAPELFKIVAKINGNLLSVLTSAEEKSLSQILQKLVQAKLNQT
ncbi:MAG: MarR family transcriptional regulator [Gammaproteobacteria bacterium]|nr:MarR family transcriptional regulator [Gammaproteobacteria bacterium]